MSPILRNILAIIGGIIIGMFANMILVMQGSSIIPPPAGVDPTDLDSIIAHADLFEPKHFIFPFLAHAAGTLLAAWMAVKMCANQHLKVALIIGGVMLVAGIVNAFSIPLPVWFIGGDLLMAYIPMAWLGYKLAGGDKKSISFS